FLKKTGIITLKMHPKTLKNGQYKLPPSLREQIGSMILGACGSRQNNAGAKINKKTATVYTVAVFLFCNLRGG
ncbi:MAG TPA: hypothetical protein PK715_17170, partial [Chitinophagales bacterium]|nr:hypothetical protein [Chitinophagales bacterium]